MKEFLKSRNKSITPPVPTIKKNFKKDFLNWLEVSESSKSEEALKSKLEKSRTEFKMPFVLQELLLKRVSSLEVDAPCYMPPKLLTT